ncbi:hypothetical protein ACIQUM_25795 [Amycolatopsis azurea]|uniref:hypothetical protein n=1 Tax=Amycolatopsis azurea TaxID=36819 RepID=UPI003817FCCB
MGSDWSWTLTLPDGASNPAAIERLLDLAGTFGLSPHRPDGGHNGFDNSPGHEGEHRVLSKEQLVRGLAEGTWSTNLWTRSEVDVWLSTAPSGQTVSLSLDSCHCRRIPDARAEPFRELHRRLTELWTAIAGETGALFGRVEDEWSLEQIWSELPGPLPDVSAPPLGSWPDWLSWHTYFDAARYRMLPSLPAELDVRRTPGGGAVIVLAADPAAADPLEFARLHRRYRQMPNKAEALPDANF